MKSSNQHRLLSYGMYIVPLLFMVAFCYSLFPESLFYGADDYDYWEIVIPDKAQSSVFNNVIQVRSSDEVMRWIGEEESVFLWRFHEN